MHILGLKIYFICGALVGVLLMFAGDSVQAQFGRRSIGVRSARSANGVQPIYVPVPVPVPVPSTRFRSRVGYQPQFYGGNHLDYRGLTRHPFAYAPQPSYVPPEQLRAASGYRTESRFGRATYKINNRLSRSTPSSLGRPPYSTNAYSQRSNANPSLRRPASPTSNTEQRARLNANLRRAGSSPQRSTASLTPPPSVASLNPPRSIHSRPTVASLRTPQPGSQRRPSPTYRPPKLAPAANLNEPAPQLNTSLPLEAFATGGNRDGSLPAGIAGPSPTGTTVAATVSDGAPGIQLRYPADARTSFSYQIDGKQYRFRPGQSRRFAGDRDLKLRFSAGRGRGDRIATLNPNQRYLFDHREDEGWVLIPDLSPPPQPASTRAVAPPQAITPAQNAPADDLFSDTPDGDGEQSILDLDD